MQDLEELCGEIRAESEARMEIYNREMEEEQKKLRHEHEKRIKNLTEREKSMLERKKKIYKIRQNGEEERFRRDYSVLKKREIIDEILEETYQMYVKKCRANCFEWLENMLADMDLSGKCKMVFYAPKNCFLEPKEEMKLQKLAKGKNGCLEMEQCLVDSFQQGGFQLYWEGKKYNGLLKDLFEEKRGELEILCQNLIMSTLMQELRL